MKNQKIPHSEQLQNTTLSEQLQNTTLSEQLQNTTLSEQLHISHVKIVERGKINTSNTYT